jgi:hypothetical protein
MGEKWLDLVVVGFEDGRFIVAAAFAFIGMHAATATGIASLVEQGGGIKFIHAVMMIDHHPAAESKVDHHHYASHELHSGQNYRKFRWKAIYGVKVL